MNKEWLFLSEAEKILKAREQAPRACIAMLIVKGHWRSVQPFQPWARSNGRWLEHPEFDIQTSRMVVEIHTLRRGPAGAAAARQWRGILVSKAAIDELWPEMPPQDNQQKPASERAKRQAEHYFLSTIVHGERVNEEAALELVRERFPSLSANYFHKTIWPKRPEPWKQSGPISRKA